MTKAVAVFTAMEDEPEVDLVGQEKCALVFRSTANGAWACSRRPGHRGPHRAFPHHDYRNGAKYEWRT